MITILHKNISYKGPFEAKTLSRNIERYDKDAWKLVIKEVCLPRNQAKFEQNILLKRFLKSTSLTQLGESSYDKLWGTGLPLHDKMPQIHHIGAISDY